MIFFNSISGTDDEEVIVKELNKMVVWNMQVGQDPNI